MGPPIQYDQCPCKKGEFGQIHTEEDVKKAEIGVIVLRWPENHQKLEERRVTDSPSQPSKEPTLLTS